MLAAFRQAEAACAAGDLPAARRHLETAEAMAPPGSAPLWLKLFEAELLRAEGYESAARELLEALRQQYPGEFWPAFHLAGLARKEGDLATARMHLDAILALGESDRNVWVRLLEADLLQDERREGEASRALERAASLFPDNVVAHRRLAQLAERRGDLAGARAHYENALTIDGKAVELHLSVARLLRAEGFWAAAVQRLEILRKRFGDDIRILMQLVTLYRAARDSEREQQLLARAVKADVLDPGLLRHFFITRAKAVPYDDLTATLTQLRPLVTPALADELLVSLQLQAMQFPDALSGLRRTGKARRSQGEARQLVIALLGAHRHELGLRYLRLCLRRWPDSETLWAAYVPAALKLGRPEEVALLLDELGAHLHGAVALEHRFSLAGFRNDLESAVACYAQLRALDRDQPAHRTVLGKLVYTRQDLATAGALFDRIGNPGGQDTPLLHRGGLVGMMTLEFDLERQALESFGGFETLADWVRMRPGSTIAAIRLVDAWRSEGDASDATETVAVPRRIWQYWNGTETPPALAPMIASWAGAAGFEHRLMNRSEALGYLRETMGTDWVRAFHLAQNPAQEADLLRLCLLAREGGVWADADDFLYGDFEPVLAAGPGLILYREPQGGALANNVMAAPPRHPVVIHAARMACLALQQRANENAWNKTGPGLLTRVLAQYLVQAGFEEVRRQVTLLDWTAVARQVAVHNPVSYKTSGAYWTRANMRPPEDPAWDGFRAAIAARMRAEAGVAAG